MILFESGALLYNSSASSNPACDVKGVQSLSGFGGVPGGRNSPSTEHGLP